MLTDDELKKLWLSPDFPGGLSGPKNFRAFLKTDFGEDISIARIIKVLRIIPNYMYMVKSRKVTQHRHYNVSSFGQLLEMDLGFLKPYNSLVAFLIVIDVFSNHIWAQPLRNKSAPTVRKALTIIFDSIMKPISEVSCAISEVATDQGMYTTIIHYQVKKYILTLFTLVAGTEFTGNKSFFAERNIYFSLKYGKNKILFAIATH